MLLATSTTYFCWETHHALSTYHQSLGAMYPNQTLLDALTAHQPPFTGRCSQIPTQTTQRSAFLRVALALSEAKKKSSHPIVHARTHTHTLWHSLAMCSQQLSWRVKTHVSTRGGGCWWGGGWGSHACGLHTSATCWLFPLLWTQERWWGLWGGSGPTLCLSSAPRLHFAADPKPR